MEPDAPVGLDRLRKKEYADHAARTLHQRFKAAAIAGLPEKHWSLTDDLVRIFETMCKERPWLDRQAVLEDGPTVLLDRYAEHPGEFVTIVAIVPHDAAPKRTMKSWHHCRTEAS